MELLNPTLQKLEKAEKVLGSLDKHYVRQVYPQFQEDFKNLGITDIDNYANYNLQNILDDLTHLSALLDGSPSKRQFHRKIEFLVQLSEGALKRALKLPIKDTKKVLRETANIANKDQSSQSTEKVAAKMPLAPSRQEVVGSKQAITQKKEVEAIKEIKTTTKDTILKKSHETSPKKAKGPDGPTISLKEAKKDYKKKTFSKEEKLLAKISEDLEREDSSPTAPITRYVPPIKHVEAEEIDWKLTEEQQSTIQNTLKKYDMSESVWKNYILTRVHGDAQLRRMGIETGSAKEVDCAIETMKFVEELERHMSRKTRSNKRSPLIQLKPIQSDPVKPSIVEQETNSMALSLSNEFPKTTTGKANTLPALDVVTTSLQELPNKEKSTRNLYLSHSMSTKEIRNQAFPSANLDNKNLSIITAEKTKFSDLKNLPISTSSLANCNLLNKFSPINTLEKSFNPNELPDSLHDSLHGSLIEHPSMLKFVKSQGKFRLPSISSSSSYIDKLSQIESPDPVITHKTITGRRYKKVFGEDNHAKTVVRNKELHDSIDDSLQAYSSESPNKIDNKIYELENHDNSLASNAGTVDSKYLRSLEDLSGSGGDTKEETNRKEGKISSKHNDSLMSESESLNDRSDLHDSARSLVTVASHDDNSRMGISRHFTQSGKASVINMDKEYSGNVRRLCLLGSGSEAKVFLCRIKGFEGEVALKQYDLVESQKKNTEAYDSLRSEFEMLRSLQHDNIIQYVCLYKPNKSKYNNCIEFGIVMEYMKGGSLESLIEEGLSNTSFVTKKRIIKQIISGLSFLHQHNIIHRDLKPGNILLSQDKSQVKISDFGISKKTEHDTNTKRTLVGTPWYMAPEVISQESYGSKADIWSLGCCIFHLITGHKPYNNANAIQALLLMVNYQNPIDNCSPEVSAKIDNHPGMREFLTQCFNRNQSERPSAEALLQDPIFDEVRE